MASRWFNGVVVLFWLTTMCWLVVAKVLPPLNRGEPPSYQTVFGGQKSASPEPPIGWNICWNDRQLGWAVSRVDRTPSGVSEVRSRVHFDRIPLEDMVPMLMRRMMSSTISSAEQMKIDAVSSLEIDPLGKLSGFRSRLRVSDYPNVIQVRGTVDGSQLTMVVNQGEPMKHYLPADAMLGDELSPQGRMPGLRLGQTWTVPVCSVLQPQPMQKPKIEILQARVEDHEAITWNGGSVQTLVVVYRADAGTGFRAVHEPRGKLWVDQSGLVLKQECNLYNSRLTFERLNATDAANMIENLPDSQWFELSSP